MTVRDVAGHLGLDWKTVKEADKLFLEARCGQPDDAGLRILAVDKGARYLLLKNRRTLRRRSHRRQLRELPALNEGIRAVMILKEKLKRLWRYRSRTWAARALDQWCAPARSLKQNALSAFAEVLQRHRHGILNHCGYPIPTGKLGGVGNKIKVIKRKAYGSYDLRCFTLKIHQAFAD